MVRRQRYQPKEWSTAGAMDRVKRAWFDTAAGINTPDGYEWEARRVVSLLQSTAARCAAMAEDQSRQLSRTGNNEGAKALDDLGESIRRAFKLAL